MERRRRTRRRRRKRRGNKEEVRRRGRSSKQRQGERASSKGPPATKMVRDLSFNNNVIFGFSTYFNSKVLVSFCEGK